MRAKAGDHGRMQGWIERWSALWGLPGLPGRVTLAFSPRLRRSLGRCDPRRGLVRLNPALLDGEDGLLVETLCHEVAHVAAHDLHGRGIRPHGKEWRALMRRAGFEPRATLPAAALSPALRRRAAPARPRRRSRPAAVLSWLLGYRRA